jgi:predicted lipid-binding transport protein (Tim44 family)
MNFRHFFSMLAVAAVIAFTLGAADTAFAQQKKAAGAGKHQACLAKARAENPDRTAGHARQAAFNSCMGR